MYIINDIYNILKECYFDEILHALKHRLFKNTIKLNFDITSYSIVNSLSSERIDWGLQKLGIPNTWSISMGEDVRIGVLDSGIDITHPDLKNNIAQTKNFTNTQNVLDKIGHGTHCSGIILAEQNSIGIIGVAPKSKLYVGKVLDDNGNGNMTSIIDGINWCIENHVDIINMSLGSNAPYEPLKQTIDRAIARGIVIVAACGNNGDLNGRPFTTTWPSNYQCVISVGSVGRDGIGNIRRSHYSSVGDCVDILAPGEEIYSCFPDGKWAKLSGTSMSCPYISGLVALIISKHKKAQGSTPVNNWQDVLNHLKFCATSLGLDRKHQGFGLINPERVVNES